MQGHGSNWWLGAVLLAIAALLAITVLIATQAFDGESVTDPFDATLPSRADPAGGSRPIRTDVSVLSRQAVEYLEARLTMLRPDSLNMPQALSRLNPDARARLKLVVLRGSQPVPGATLRFATGGNHGRSLTSGRSGNIVMHDLWPGPADLEVVTPGGRSARRRVVLEVDRDQTVVIDFGTLVEVRGRILDWQGRTVREAEVMLDGQTTTSGEDGHFTFTEVTCGQVPILVRKAQYTTQQSEVQITAAAPPRDVQIKLVPGSWVVLTVDAPADVQGDAQVFIVPTTGPDGLSEAQRRFPWHEVNPLEVPVGKTTFFQFLPAGAVAVCAVHAVATTRPRWHKGTLPYARMLTVNLRLVHQPMVRGRVRRGGQSVGGAALRWAAFDRSKLATGFMLGSSSALPALSGRHDHIAVQMLRSAADGSFAIRSSTELILRGIVTCRKGDLVAAALLNPGESHVALTARSRIHSRLDVRLPIQKRFEGAQVEVRVGDELRSDLATVGASGRLSVWGLEPGQWRLELDHQGQTIYRGNVVTR